MRNFNDFIRALGGIHNVLSGIASKIDLIPASEPVSIPEWTKVTNTSNTQVLIEMDSVTDGILVGVKASAGFAPVYISKKYMEDNWTAASQSICLWGGNFASIVNVVATVYKIDDNYRLDITGSSTIDSAYRVWNVYKR